MGEQVLIDGNIICYANMPLTEEDIKLIDILRDAGIEFHVSLLAIKYGTWIQKNCIVSRNGFRLLPAIMLIMTSRISGGYIMVVAIVFLRRNY